jgi:hypothetical protein
MSERDDDYPAPDEPGSAKPHDTGGDVTGTEDGLAAESETDESAVNESAVDESAVDESAAKEAAAGEKAAAVAAWSKEAADDAETAEAAWSEEATDNTEPADAAWSKEAADDDDGAGPVEALNEAELNEMIEQLCNSKADEFRMLGYEQVTGREVWDCIAEKYQKKGFPPLHQIVNDILSLKSTQFMNWMTMSIYKNPQF